MSIDNNDRDITESVIRVSTKKEKLDNRIAWRRNKVMELYMSGITNQYQIARELKVSQSLVSNDLKYILEQSRNEIHNVIQDKLPLLYKKTDELLNFITTEAIRIYKNANTDMQKIAALNLAKDTASQQFELSTNSTILSDAMNFVASHSQTLDNITKALADRDAKHEKHKQTQQTEQQEQEKEQQQQKGEDLIDEEIQDNYDLSTSLQQHSEDT